MSASATATLDEYERQRNRKRGDGICGLCQHPYDSQTERLQRLSIGFAHEDCYYNALGDLIERHPITSPRGGRGMANVEL